MNASAGDPGLHIGNIPRVKTVKFVSFRTGDPTRDNQFLQGHIAVCRF